MQNSNPLLFDGSVYNAVNNVVHTAIRNGIGVKLQQTEMVDIGDGVLCSGAFDSGSATSVPCLYVAMKKPVEEWLPVLLHEGSHMDQFIQDAACWKALREDFDPHADQMFFEWIAGERECDAETIAKLARVLAEVELDCEIRTVDKIMNSDLGNIIDVGQYIQKANSYVMFYTYIGKYNVRKFYPVDRVPYKTPEIYKKFPRYFIEDISNLTEEYKLLYDSIMMCN